MIKKALLGGAIFVAVVVGVMAVVAMVGSSPTTTSVPVLTRNTTAQTTPTTPWDGTASQYVGFKIISQDRTFAVREITYEGLNTARASVHLTLVISPAPSPRAKWLPGALTLRRPSQKPTSATTRLENLVDGLQVHATFTGVPSASLRESGNAAVVIRLSTPNGPWDLVLAPEFPEPIAVSTVPETFTSTAPDVSTAPAESTTLPITSTSPPTTDAFPAQTAPVMPATTTPTDDPSATSTTPGARP